MLTDDQWRRLLTWKGYGNPGGRFWFVGYEEAGAEDNQENLRENSIKSGFPEICDLRAAHAPDTLGLVGGMIPTWTIMSRLVLRLNGATDWCETEQSRAYQANRLGRDNGETFLTDLLPIRKKASASMPEWTKVRWKSWDKYFQEAWNERRNMLRMLWVLHRPEYTFCYGTGWWRERFKELFPTSFEQQLSGKLELGRDGGSTIVLTPFFSTRTGMTRDFIDSVADVLA
jgi:hypothetical protein